MQENGSTPLTIQLSAAFSTNPLTTYRADLLLVGSHRSGVTRKISTLPPLSMSLPDWGHLSLPHSCDLLVPVITHSFWECFPIMLFHWCWCPGPSPQLHRSVSSSLCLPASHLLSRESSAKRKPLLQWQSSFQCSSATLLPEHTEEVVSQNPREAICSKWIII